MAGDNHRRPGEPRPRPHRASPRFSAEEWQQITTAAHAAHLAPAAFIALAATAAAAADEPEAVITERRHAVAALMRAERAAVRIGTNLNQLTRYLHSDLPVPAAALAAALDDAREALDALARAGQQVAGGYR